MDLKPILVLPFNDAKGLVWRSFQPVIPLLKEIFERIYLGIPEDTARVQPEFMNALRADRFFLVLETPAGQAAGEYFLEVYQWAARNCVSEQVLHLAFPDRVAFALGSLYRDLFMEDVRQLTNEDTPLLFARSERAWRTHPNNYRQAEAMVTAAGEMLFGKKLDFAWCHLVMTAERLARVLPLLTRKDMSMLAEMVVCLMEDVKMREVDWLAWEDPFILGRDAAALKAERELSTTQSRWRLQYAIPMMSVMLKYAQGDKNL